MKTLFEVVAVKKGAEIYRATFETETDGQAVELAKFYAGTNARGAKFKASEVAA